MFPTEQEVKERFDSGLGVIGKGSYKKCYDYSDEFVLLEITYEYTGECGDEWLGICADLGLIKAKFYQIGDKDLWIVERLNVPYTTCGHPEEVSQFFFTDELSAAFAKLFPSWYNAAQTFKEVFKTTYLDMKCNNVGYRKDGTPIFFDIVR